MRIEKEIKLQQQSSFANQLIKKKCVLLKDICDTLPKFHILLNNLDKVFHSDTYFDTDDFLLYSTDASLRIRHNQNRLILKGMPEFSSLLLCRKEWQYYLTDGENAIDAANALFHKHICNVPIYPKLDIHLIRDSIYVTTDSGKYQICLDECIYQIINKNISQQYFEIEIETIMSHAENDTSLNKFINYIMEIYNLTNIYQSKYHIGISSYMKKE